MPLRKNSQASLTEVKGDDNEMSAADVSKRWEQVRQRREAMDRGAPVAGPGSTPISVKARRLLQHAWDSGGAALGMALAGWSSVVWGFYEALEAAWVLWIGGGLFILGLVGVRYLFLKVFWYGLYELSQADPDDFDEEPPSSE